MSYIGNLLFVLLGGKAADRYDRKKVFLYVLAMWTGAQILFACTGSYETDINDSEAKCDETKTN
jgi:MFS family permease